MRKTERDVNTYTHRVKYTYTPAQENTNFYQWHILYEKAHIQPEIAIKDDVKGMTNAF